MPFTIGKEKQNRMPFLDVQIIHEEKSFIISVYGKPNFSGVFKNFESFLSPTYMFGTVKALAYKCVRIGSSWTELHIELV